MTNAILVLTVVVGLIGAAAAYGREGEFQPHHEGGGDREGPQRFGPQGGPGGPPRFGPPGPPFGGDHGKMMRMKVLMGIHETICFGLPTPNFTRPENNNNNQRFGPHPARAVQHMMSAAVMPHQTPIFGGPADEPINVNSNITDEVRKEEATLVRAVARQAASLMTCGGATDDNCAALTAAEQRLIDFRRNHSMSCEFEGHNNDNHEQFGRPPMPVPPQAPVQPQPARLPINNNAGSGASFSSQQQQQQQPILNHQPQQQFAQQQQQQQPRPGNFNGNNNFQPAQAHNNNMMHTGRK